MSWRFCTCRSVEGRGRLALTMIGLVLSFGTASAGEAGLPTDTHRQDGVTLRLIALPPDAGGEVRGALSIELAAGWKTYWIAPGPVGLSPRLDFSASTGLSGPVAAFPVPGRFQEGGAQGVGYSQSVVLPLRAVATAPTPVLRLDAFLGVCRDLCVPVQAVLTSEGSKSLSDRAIVARAQADAPAQTGALSAQSAQWNEDGTALLVAISGLNDRQPPDAFVSAGDGWSFGPPTLQAEGANRRLALPVLARPSGATGLESVDVLLTAGEIAQLSRAVPITRR